MPKRIEVRREGDAFWFAASLAAKKSGLSKADLAMRALAGELRYQSDHLDEPGWYAEEQIMALAEAHREAELLKASKPKRQKTDAQIEALATRQWQADAKGATPARNSAVSAHLERVMLWNIEQNNKRRKDEEEN